MVAVAGAASVAHHLEVRAMAHIPEGVDLQELTVVARKVLLDALDALQEHRDGTILVGAQAVYLRAKEAALTVAPYTSDADLGLDPARIGDVPLLEEAMRGAGFSLTATNQPGTWVRPEKIGELTENIAVDLLVPTALVPKNTRRSVQIGQHDRMAVRKVPGIELATVDNELLRIDSLDSDDTRSFEIKVAGVAALLVAKAYKLADRFQDVNLSRLGNKDAGDVVRLMMTSQAADVGLTLAGLMADDAVAEVAREGLARLQQQFGAPRAPGTELAVAALEGAMPEQTVRALAPAYIRDLTA
jgi:hypothetical protein